MAIKKKTKSTPGAKSKAAKKPVKTLSKTSTALDLSSKAYALLLPATGHSPQLSLKAFAGQALVVYFYPKDNTPGCTIESQDFAKLYSQFKKAGANVVGISRDAMKSHDSFKAKFALPFELISDEQDQLTKAFDVLRMKSMYGKTFLGIERSTFVFDSRGELLREWRKVKVEGHAKEVLDFLKNQGK